MKKIKPGYYMCFSGVFYVVYLNGDYESSYFGFFWTPGHVTNNPLFKHYAETLTRLGPL